jgi:hypothetical protein
MKTSNRFLLAAICLVVFSIGFYDLDLRAEYLKNDYKNPYRNFITLNNKGFKAIKLNASTAVNVMLVKGPFKIMIDPSAHDIVKISQQADTLIINANFKYNYESMHSLFVLYISCPSLSSFQADAYYGLGRTTITDTLAGEDFKWKPSIITGFTSDSLHISENHASNIELRNNTIGKLQAVIGTGTGSASNLVIGPGNKFNNTNITVLNNSRLWLKSAADNRLNYHLADSAKLIINGAAQNQQK